MTVKESAVGNSNSKTSRRQSSPLVSRFFTDGVHPFEKIEWDIRDAVIPGLDGNVFEQRNVEFPKSWSQNSTNIVAQKYFRGKMNTEQRETSVKQMIGRVADTITEWG